MHDTVVGDYNYAYHQHTFGLGNKYGERIIGIQVIVCPNKECREFVLRAYLYGVEEKRVAGVVQTAAGKVIKDWQLVPVSNAKVFPDYVPKAVRDDYSEACVIQNGSPKASATLARRCLQGMIRDFWKIHKPRLVDEIDELKDKVEPSVWAAIDALRKLGNIGAHMEKDVNLIVDIDADEAGQLIRLIEFLVEQWYVRRHEQQVMLDQIIQTAQQKEQPKREGTPQASGSKTD
jgi:hypothetical protein